MPTMAKNPCGYLDDARRLWERRLCLEPVSKNVEGRLELLNRERQECEEPKCLTLKTDHLLKLEVRSNDPCDSDVGKRLDGVLVVRRLVHALNNGTGEGRGIHTGEFVWMADGMQIEGELSGMTNVGTHREPPFDPCQQCHDPGYMEGRLCGRIVKAEDDRLLGCRVVAAYRFRFDASEGFQDTGVRGTIEGAVVCTCDDGKCINFGSFPVADHTNPWDIGGCRFMVFDHDSAQTANTTIESWGGFVGLNAGYQTRIDLSSPANSVAVTLVNFSSEPTVAAVDSGGVPLDSAMLASTGNAETVVLNGAGIAAVLIRSPQNETLILEFCVQG